MYKIVFFEFQILFKQYMYRVHLIKCFILIHWIKTCWKVLQSNSLMGISSRLINVTQRRWRKIKIYDIYRLVKDAYQNEKISSFTNKYAKDFLLTKGFDADIIKKFMNTFSKKSKDACRSSMKFEMKYTSWIEDDLGEIITWNHQ